MNLENITFGIELETIIPRNANIAIGDHGEGRPINTGTTPVGLVVTAPKFEGKAWKGDRDPSIVTANHFAACEFVSPVLKGEAGVLHVIEFLNFLTSIGAKVNSSCGMHVHIGLSAAGDTEEQKLHFVKILTRLVNRKATALHAQTGTISRETGCWCAMAGQSYRSAVNAAGRSKSLNAARVNTRYHLLNLASIPRHGTVEFRCFAGTLNTKKVLLHLFSVFTFCRQAAERKGLLSWADPREQFTGSQMLNGCDESEIPADAATANDHRNPRGRRNRTEEENEVGIIVQPEPRHSLESLVLHVEAKDAILAGLRSIEMRSELERIWNIGQIQPQQGRCILNFYGDPGTGKTRAALAIALRLGKPLYQVDYSAVISKYMGDTAKHIVQAFKRASELGAVLFFDEADSLLSRRVPAGESCSTSINQNRNTLMQELDRFNGVVIMTTNLFGNYDPALLRRIARHVEFKGPNRSMRKALFEAHLPNLQRVEADLLNVARASVGLAGGDILNICLAAMEAGSTDPNPENWKVTEPMLLAEVDKAKAAKARHAGREVAPLPHIGFNAEKELAD